MSFREQLLREVEGSELNFEGLLQLIDCENIPMFNAVLTQGINGMATKKGVYVNILEILHRQDDEKLFFVISHEIGHYKRMSHYTNQELLDKIIKNDYIDYVNYVMDEEIFADRYGRLVFRLLNSEDFPKDRTQQLEKESHRHVYSKRLEGTYLYIKDNLKTVEDYQNVFDNFVTHVR